MGGSALLIYGTVSDRLLEPRAVPRSIVDRLTGRVRTAAPAWSEIGVDRRMIQLPADQLKDLGPEFIRYVENRLKPPWPATAWVLEYLNLGVMTIYVRGDASGSNPPEWYVQITFSGCAGMSEVSAELAVHWAERWYREHQADLAADYFKPYGFEPDGRTQPGAPGAIFAPFGTAGYALFNSSADSEQQFEIDAAAETSPKGLPQLDSCGCQLCAPENAG